ncbi:MAG: ABC transporter permease subunit [Thermoplasmata archaeon]
MKALSFALGLLILLSGFAQAVSVDNTGSYSCKIVWDSKGAGEYRILLIGNETTVYDTVFADLRADELALYETYFFEVEFTWQNGTKARAVAINGSAHVPADAKTIAYNLTGLSPTTNYRLEVRHGNDVESIEFTTLAEVVQLPKNDLSVYAVLAVVVGSFALLIGWLAKMEKKKLRSAYIYIAPALLGLVLLTFYPVLYGFFLSFTDYSLSYSQEYNFVGLENYLNVLFTPDFSLVLTTTIIWTVGCVALHVLIGIFLAVLLNRKIKGRVVYRAILLLPWAVPSYISVLTWRSMLEYGGALSTPFNSFLGTNIDFLNSMPWALVAVIMVNVWLGFSYMMMVFSGALQGIPEELYEAADVDGFSRWQKFRYITLPLLKPAIIPAALLGFIWTFNMFNVIYLLTGGGPVGKVGVSAGSTDILITFVYDQAFLYWRIGFAAAYSVVIFMMLLAFSVIYLRAGGGGESVYFTARKNSWLSAEVGTRIVLYAVGVVYLAAFLGIAFAGTNFAGIHYQNLLGIGFIFSALLIALKYREGIAIAKLFALFDFIVSLAVIVWYATVKPAEIVAGVNLMLFADVVVLYLTGKIWFEKSFGAAEPIERMLALPKRGLTKIGEVIGSIRIEMGIRKKKLVEDAIVHLILLLFSILALLPVVGIIGTSLWPGNVRVSLAVPSAVSMEHYTHVLYETQFFIWLRNSLLVAGGTTILGILLATTAAYAFSRFNFRGKKGFMLSFLVVQMFPGVIILIPYYILMRQLGLANTFIGLILAYAVTALPLAVWMIKGFFDTIPPDLEESAMVDGCGRVSAFYRVVLPLAKPAVAVVALFSFLAAWNEFVLAYTFMSDESMYTLPVGLTSFVGAGGMQTTADWGSFAAMSVLVAIPVCLLFIVFQKYLVSGLTKGGVKG